MRYCIVFALLMLPATAVSAFTKEELDAIAAAARQRVADAAGIDLSGDPGGSGGATGQYANCIGSAPGGRISLLGVESDMGPSTQGVTPVAKINPEHPAKKELIELGKQMGWYQDAEDASDEEIARNAAAYERKVLHDTYAQFLGYTESGTALGGTPMADLFGWVYEGRMEEMAKAYAEYHPLALQYATLHKAAEGVCP